MISPINNTIKYSNFYIKQKPQKKPVVFSGFKKGNPKPSKSASNDVFALFNSFLRQRIINTRLSLLNPIKTQDEYKKLFAEVMKYLLYEATDSNDKNCIRYDNFKNAAKVFGIDKITADDIKYINFKGYEDVDFELKALVPYCGFADISREINQWLTGRTTTHVCRLNDIQMSNIIRLFEYSLAQLDKKYGKFDSTVYRAGYFNPIKDKQYYSTSYYLSSAVQHGLRQEPSEKMPYSIIRLKNGHDIYQFQKNAGSEISQIYADTEREILIDRKSKFRLVPRNEYSDNDIDDIKKLIFLTIDCDLEDLSKDRFKEMSEHISVWEEI